jgi:hypothetical protein
LTQWNGANAHSLFSTGSSSLVHLRGAEESGAVGRARLRDEHGYLAPGGATKAVFEARSASLTTSSAVAVYAVEGRSTVFHLWLHLVPDLSASFCLSR